MKHSGALRSKAYTGSIFCARLARGDIYSSSRAYQLSSPHSLQAKKHRLALAQTQRGEQRTTKKTTMARSAAPPDEENVRAPDPQQRMRLVEPTQQVDDAFAWTDEARVQVAVQTTALLLASCVYCVGDEWRALALALVWGNASLALSAQRERRQPAP